MSFFPDKIGIENDILCVLALQGQTLVNEGVFGFVLWLEKTSKITQSNPDAR